MQLEKNSNFLLFSNRIACYYKSVFNIEIQTLLCKNLKNSNDYDLATYLENLKKNNEFFIVIKDNNKKIFKTKILKAVYDKNRVAVSNEYLDLNEKLFWFVDETLAEYCKKHYINKSKDLKDIINKDNEINEDFKIWVIENIDKFKQK